MFPIARILLPVDFSARAEHAARAAAAVAERFGSEIVLLHVLPPSAEFTTLEMGTAILNDLLVERKKSVRERTAVFMKEELGRLPVRRMVLEGDPAHQIVQCARDEHASLIMMPTHGYGPFRRMLLGSVTAKVLHDADCPVWTTAHVENLEARASAISRIVCAVDLGPSSARALELAARLAAELGATLTLVHSLVELDPRLEGYHFSPEWRKFVVDTAKAEIDRLQKTAGTQAKVELTEGPVALAVCEEAGIANADLLVIGRATDDGALGRLTSDAYAIIRQSPCPVVSV